MLSDAFVIERVPAVAEELAGGRSLVTDLEKFRESPTKSRINNTPGQPILGGNDIGSHISALLRSPLEILLTMIS